MLRYPLNGRPSAFYRGDWFVGKSAASVVIKPPGVNTRPIELLSTHLHAPYGPGDAAYTCHRTGQAWELARLAKRASDLGHAVFVLGDLNSIPGSLSHRLFQHVALLRDTWEDIHGEYEGGPEAIALLSPEDQILVAGTTCDSRLNTWRADRRPDEAKRLDYIFYDPKHATPVSCKVSFTEKIPGIGSYSDHFAVEASVIIKPINKVNTNNDAPLIQPLVTDSKKEGYAHNSPAPSSENSSYFENPYNKQVMADISVDQPNKPKDLSLAQIKPDKEELKLLYTDILELIEDYKPTSIKQAKLRNAHFIASVVVLIGLLIAVWWGAAHDRAYVGFIFLLLTIVISVTGLLDGLIGFLFGRNEWRALLEFQSEVELALDFLD